MQYCVPLKISVKEKGPLGRDSGPCINLCCLLYNFVLYSSLLSRHTVVCRAAKDAGTSKGTSHCEYINRKNYKMQLAIAIFTHAYSSMTLSEKHAIFAL